MKTLIKICSFLFMFFLLIPLSFAQERKQSKKEIYHFFQNDYPPREIVHLVQRAALKLSQVGLDEFMKIEEISDPKQSMDEFGGGSVLVFTCHQSGGSLFFHHPQDPSNDKERATDSPIELLENQGEFPLEQLCNRALLNRQGAWIRQTQRPGKEEGLHYLMFAVLAGNTGYSVAASLPYPNTPEYTPKKLNQKLSQWSLTTFKKKK